MRDVWVYRDRKDTAVTFFLLGCLVGLIVGLASCEPTDSVPAAVSVGVSDD